MTRGNSLRNIESRQWIDRAPRYAPMPDENNHLEYLVLTGSLQRGRGWYENISSTGFRFNSKIPIDLQPGDELQVLLPMPGSAEKFTAKAIVQRVVTNQQTFAMRFIDLTASQRKLLETRVGWALSHVHDVLRTRFWQEISSWWSDNKVTIMLIAIAITLLVWSFHFLMQPNGKYSMTEKYAWGTRFEANKAPEWLDNLSDKESKLPLGSK